MQDGFSSYIDTSSFLSSENIGGDILYVNPLNANKGNPSRLKGLGRPDRPYERIQDAIHQALPSDTIKIVSDVTENFILDKECLVYICKNVTVTGQITLRGNTYIEGENIRSSKLINESDNLLVSSFPSGSSINKCYITNMKLECPNHSLMIKTGLSWQGGELHLKSIWATGNDGFLGDFQKVVSVIDSQVETNNQGFTINANKTNFICNGSFIQTVNEILLRNTSNQFYAFQIHNSTLISIAGVAINAGTNNSSGDFKNAITNSYIFAATTAIQLNSNSNGQIVKSLKIINTKIIAPTMLAITRGNLSLTNLLLLEVDCSGIDVGGFGAGNIINRDNLKFESNVTMLENLGYDGMKLYF